MPRLIGLWGFSSRFAVYEPAPSFPRELTQKHQPRLAPWPNPVLTEVLEGGKSFPLGDFPATSGFMHLVSPRAVDAMGEVFARYGTLYPVDVDGQVGEWRLFQPTTVIDCLDLERSRVSRSAIRAERIDSILNPAFFEDKLPEGGLFLVPQCLHGDIYVCEDIKALVKKHKLKGFVLQPDYFGKPWIS